jgi:hypothetical protein
VRGYFNVFSFVPQGMKLRNIALHAVVLMLQILSPALFAQKEFEDAHDRTRTSCSRAG